MNIQNPLEKSWDEFKNMVNEEKRMGWVYRGHASQHWNLESTLYRCIKNKKTTEVQAAAYHKMICRIVENEEVSSDSDFKKINYPSKSPFLSGIIVGNEKHRCEFRETFDALILLRHLGFPSPLLDWSSDPFIAAFFAFNNTLEDDCAIYRMRIEVPEHCMQSNEENNVNMHLSEFDYTKTGFRHEAQFSKYLLATNQPFTDSVLAIDKQLGPYFILSDYEKIQNKYFFLEKFIIQDSGKNKLIYLNDLKKINSKYVDNKIMVREHPLESLLQDIARKVISDEVFNVTYYPRLEYLCY